MATKDYIEMYHLDTPELIAKHIECLKRNTKPDLVLISSLAKKLIKKDIDIPKFEADFKKEMIVNFNKARENFLNACIFSKAEKDILEIESMKALNELRNKGSFKDDVIFNHNQGEKDTMEYLKSIKVEPTEIEINSDDRFVTYKITPRTSKKDRKKIEEVQFLLKEGFVDKKEDLWQVRGEEVYKETEGKLFYELDWGFITQMAERMAANKQNSKYKMWNWQQKMSDKTFEDLKQASMRHLLEIMQGRYEDDGREFGHLEALSTNLMMINYQLKQK